jgi:transcriptional regulator with XRE-family HTH domain
MRKAKSPSTPLGHWMMAHGLTDLEVAERVKKVSRSQVCRIRHGRRTSWSVATKLAEVTGLPPEVFMQQAA